MSRWDKFISQTKDLKCMRGNVVSIVKSTGTDGPIKADPPREMRREDRRSIFAKIEEVYLDEDKGYSSGWSDAKVSQSLGVPLAWVREIREENFGIEQSNEDWRPLLEDVKNLMRDIQIQQNIITDRIVEAKKAKEELEARANFLSGKITQLEKLFK